MHIAAAICGALALASLLNACASSSPIADSSTHDGPSNTDASAESPEARPPDSAAALTYREDIHPMFEQTGCAAFQCHGGFVASAGTFVLLSDPFTGYRDMIDRVSGRRPEAQVRPFAPDESVLVEHSETTLRMMGILQQPQIDLVRRWVAEGAAYSREVDLDAGVSGNPPRDASLPDGGATACSVEGLRGHPALPAACLPRCSRATWDAIVACRSDADPAGCQGRVIDADTMRPVALGGTFEPVSLNCDRCLTWQTMSCIYDVCPWELLALQRCRAFRSADPCSAEQAAMNACIARSPGFTACQRARDSQCVPR